MLFVFELSPNIFIGNKAFHNLPSNLSSWFLLFLQSLPHVPATLNFFLISSGTPTLPLKTQLKCHFLHAISRFFIGFLPVCFHNVLIRAWQETNGTSTWITWGHFLKWAVIGEQIQEAHCERSQGIQYFTTCLFLLLICCQGPRWLNPKRSQKEKELINTVHPDQPPQGKERGGEWLWRQGKQKTSRHFYLYLNVILLLWPVAMSTFPLDSDPVIIISKFSALGKEFDHSSLLISVYWINELIREWQRWKHQEHNGCSWMFLDFYLKNFSLQLFYFNFMESDLFL